MPKVIGYSYNHPDTEYLTANLNKELTQIFKGKTENDPISISVVEDDAANIKKYMGDSHFDVIAFEHINGEAYVHWYDCVTDYIF